MPSKIFETKFKIKVMSLVKMVICKVFLCPPWTFDSKINPLIFLPQKVARLLKRLGTARLDGFFFFLQVGKCFLSKKILRQPSDPLLIDSSDDNNLLFQPFSSFTFKGAHRRWGNSTPPWKFSKFFFSRNAVKPKLGDPLAILFWKPWPSEILAKILSTPLDFQPCATMFKFKTKWGWVFIRTIRPRLPTVRKTTDQDSRRKAHSMTLCLNSNCQKFISFKRPL